MLVNTERTRAMIQGFDFKTLFIEELGWDRYTTTLDVSIDGQNYTLSAIAEKRGMVAFVCEPFVDGGIPDYPTRRKIDRQVAKAHHEHLIIYLDADMSMQIWQWVKRQAGKPAACREHAYYANQPGDSLLQKIDNLTFTLQEEEKGITIVDVAGRFKKGFDVEKVTKRFYDRFKTEHGKFTKFLKGIPEEKFQRWYVSVMLNRLMFIYFIEKKGFLGNDTNYLRSRLEQSKAHGRDRYYKSFLCPLFFEGFAKKADDRSTEINQFLGEVPYLNGGLFQQHHVEKLYGKEIQIADAAFDNLFAFFEQYQWYLDERPLRADNEINPDVLGYIFEKYINQKQMGAYYTKEDITEYISKNTIIPFLFDQAQKKCKIAFEGDQSIWQLLKDDPDRYIYDAVKKGVKLFLPKEIAVGIEDVSKRTEWNKPASQKYALPTEIWREVVARRQRYQEVRDKMLNGEITSINDLITYNLDTRQFAQDVIENCESPELLRGIYYTIAGRIPDRSNQEFHPGISVLDPTCGSGAFLFAALSILEPLYEACLDRMQVFLDELESSGQEHRSDKFGDFRRILERIQQHPNRRYFVLKSIILNNLYGVDIMEEAIEICKLRLFLKLVAQIDKIEDIEPLPDIDFNIRAGNTLVGFASHDEVKEAITTAEGGQKKILFGESIETMTRIEENAEIADRAFKRFQEMQTEFGMDAKDFSAAKQEFSNRLKVLEDELDRYLAFEYGINRSNIRNVEEYKKSFKQWHESHQPFHWFIEFYGIMKEGGFDVIIGNPPYVEYSKVKKEYTIQEYQTESCGNLYAFMVERSMQLLHESGGSYGMIVPISLPSTPRMSSGRALFEENSVITWCSNFADRPGNLFTGVHQKLSMVISKKHSDKKQHVFFTTAYRHWYGKKENDERKVLMETLAYVPAINSSLGWIKSGNLHEQSIYDKLCLQGKPITKYFQGLLTFSLNMRMMYWGKSFTTQHKSNEYKHFSAPSTLDKKVMVAVFNSSLYFWFWELVSDCWHITTKELNNFFLDLGNIIPHKTQIADLTDMLMKDLDNKKEFVGTKQTEYEYYHKLSKNIIDEIDRVFAKQYGFSDEELDFIINYDIKYRMGLI